MVGELVKSEKQNLSVEIIKKYICPKATDQEAYMFMQLCNLQGLNPFLREAYLIKYGDEAATIITGKDTFTKRADKLPQYDGFKAGIIVVDNSKQCQYREGSFLAPGETLLGGWAEVFRKDRSHSFRNEVSLEEYARKKKDGTLMSNWKSMPATMIRKVPLVQSLREAFPDEFGGMYSPEEMPVDASSLPIYTEGKAPITIQDHEEPIKQPQKKAEPESSAVNTITAIVSDVRKTMGINEKTQKPWAKFIVKCGDVEYSTFSETYAKVAKDAKELGVEAIINFTTNKFGNEIKAIVASEPGDVA
jgi:phage recombination protein Bet